MKRTLGGVILVAALVFAAGAAYAQDMGIVTGSKKGTYYQFGLNMSELVKQKGVRLRVDDSQGSVQNVFSVYKAPDTQLGIVQSDVLAFVSKIQNDPVLQRIASKTRMVFPFYNEEVHLLANAEVRDFDDLNGRIVALVITLGEVHQVGLNVGHRIGIGAGGFELLDRLTGEVTQHQAVLMGFLGHPVGRQVDRDAMIGGRRQQPLEFGPGRNVGMQRHAGAIPLSDWGMGSQQPTGFVTGAQLRRPAARSESAASGGADAHVERSVPNQLTYSQT